jgi:hypothetical protein
MSDYTMQITKKHSERKQQNNIPYKPFHFFFFGMPGGLGFLPGGEVPTDF